MRPGVNDLSIHEKAESVPNNPGSIMENGPMPKKRGNMNPASKNFNKVPPKRYKAGSASN